MFSKSDVKVLFSKSEPKLLNYRRFKSCSPQAFEEDLSEALIDCGDSYDKFENVKVKVLFSKSDVKVLFSKSEPKLLKYRRFKSCSPQAFEEDLSEALIDCGDSYDKFEIFLPQS